MYAIKTVFQDNVIIHEAIRTLINIKIKHENEGGKGGVKSYETPHYTWDVSHRNWDEPSQGKTSHYIFTCSRWLVTGNQRNIISSQGPESA